MRRSNPLLVLACGLLAAIASWASPALAQVPCRPDAPPEAIRRGLCRPTETTPPEPTSRDFCEVPENQVRATPWPAHPGNRMAQVMLDAGCSRHTAVRCTNAGPIPTGARPPIACVDVEVTQGSPAVPVTGDGAYPVECVQCPDGLQPNGGLPLCGAGSLAMATRGRVLFNLSGASVEHMQQLWREAMALRAEAVTRASGTGARPSDDAVRTALDRDTRVWQTQLVDIVRELAPQIGYCEEAPFGMLATNRGWRYADRGHRVNLASDIVYRGEGRFGSETMGTMNAALAGGADHGGLALYLTAFYARVPREGLRGAPAFDLDGLVLGLVHEMRHMGAPGFGLGSDMSASESVLNAQRFLNELEDYTRMFQHPYVIGLPASRMEGLRNAYGAGRNAMYGCFAHLWGTAGPADFPGYPDDSPRAVGMGVGMMMGGGFGGLMMPLAGLRLPARATNPPASTPPRGRRGARAPAAAPAPPAQPRPVWPQLLDSSNWSPDGWTPGICTSSGLRLTAAGSLPVLTSPAQRCTVAHWAAESEWMRSKMVRSMAPSEEHQPWNTLGHWVLALPLRMPAYAGCRAAAAE